jgi:hypothetical protein
MCLCLTENLSIKHDVTSVNSDRGNEYLQWDVWAVTLSVYLRAPYLLAACPTACTYVWPVVYTRLLACYPFVDPKCVCS